MVFSHMPRKTKIFVGHLPENCRNDELRQLFVRFGEVTECDVMNRYGFVHMAREEDAASAIKALHNINFKGATINVEQSTGKSRGGDRRNDKRGGGAMRGGRGYRSGPYNNRRGPPHQSDYSNRSAGADDQSDRYRYRQHYLPNMCNNAYLPQNIPQSYGPNAMAGLPVGNVYNRTVDHHRSADFPPRPDYNNYQQGGDFNRGPAGPVPHYAGDNFPGVRPNDPYMRNDYDRNIPGTMRNGGYGPNYADGENSNYFRQMGGDGNYSAGAPVYPAAAGPQNDIFSRRPTNPIPNAGYPPAPAGYPENYERPDAYGPPRGGNRFQGPAETMPPRDDSEESGVVDHFSENHPHTDGKN